MKGLEPMPMPEHPNWVMFQLKRNDDNREAWSVLFGRKSFFFGTRQNDEIALTIGLQDGSWGAKNRTCWRSGNSISASSCRTRLTGCAVQTLRCQSTVRGLSRHSHGKQNPVTRCICSTIQIPIRCMVLSVTAIRSVLSRYASE